MGLGHGLLPRNADDAVAVGFEDRLAGGVVLLRDRVVVPVLAVRLDDEAVFGPAEVGGEGRPVSGLFTSGGAKPPLVMRSRTASSSSLRVGT